MPETQNLTKKLIDGVPLDSLAAEIDAAAEEIMSGESTPIQIASLLTALRFRGETPDVVAAFARQLRKRAMPFRRPPGIALDTCGTGGDHSGTFNISTAAAFVAAAAGVRVAKHGNRSMTSQCGSADVLAELGVRIDGSVEEMERALDEAGICFLFAQAYHPSMRHVAPVRRELGFRTVFNLLGPLANPAGASHQVIGVFGRPQVPLVAEVLRRLGSQRALVVHGSDGLDEITTTGPTYVAELTGEGVREYEVSPENFGLKRSVPECLKGGDARENARIVMEVLSGGTGPCSDIVALNAGAAIYAAEASATLADGVARAREILASGTAMEKLEALKSAVGAPAAPAS